MHPHTTLARSHTPGDRLTASYMTALGLADLVDEPPSVAGLIALHRAHVQRFSHDTVWIARERIPALDAEVMVSTLLAGEGGGCTRLNLSFWWLLGRLGYEVRLHPSRVELTFGEAFRSWPLHPVLTIQFDDLTWYADVGMGNGLLDPIPCADGEVEQRGGFTYALERIDEGPTVWEFRQDPRMRGVRRLRFDSSSPGLVEGFRDGFHQTVTNSESPYRNSIGASRRTSDGVVVLTANALTRHGEGGRTRTRLTSAEEWEAVLREEFHLGLPEWTAEERDRLWARITEGLR